MKLQLSEDESRAALPFVSNPPLEETDSAEVAVLAGQLSKRAYKRRLLRGLTYGIGCLSIINVLIAAAAVFVISVLRSEPINFDFNPLLFGFEITERHGGRTDVSIGSFWPVLMAILITAYVRVRLASKEQRRELESLARTGDLRLVGPLVDALDLGGRDDRELAREQLPLLLPRLRPADSALLSNLQREALRRHLLSQPAPVARSILRAWEQIGDEKDIPLAEKLSQGRGSAGQDSEVRALAADCVQSLKMRASSTKSGDALLRPASAGDAEDALLRPALSELSDDPDSLLRPTSAG